MWVEGWGSWVGAYAVCRGEEWHARRGKELWAGVKDLGFRVSGLGFRGGKELWFGVWGSGRAAQAT